MDHCIFCGRTNEAIQNDLVTIALTHRRMISDAFNKSSKSIEQANRKKNERIQHIQELVKEIPKDLLLFSIEDVFNKKNSIENIKLKELIAYLEKERMIVIRNSPINSKLNKITLKAIIDSHSAEKNIITQNSIENDEKYIEIQKIIKSIECNYYLEESEIYITESGDILSYSGLEFDKVKKIKLISTVCKICKARHSQIQYMISRM